MKGHFFQKLFPVISAFALVLIFFNEVEAQVWCPPGAKWYYNGDASMFSGYHELTYTGDSIVSSKNCQKIVDHLQGHGFPADVNAIVDSFYTYTESGVVYLYNNRYGMNRFDTLFNINAAIGDKWTMPLADTTCDSLNITVLDTGTTIINSLNLKWLFVKFKPSNASSYINDTIIERIGFVKTFFYFPMVCQYIDERIFSGLRCYSDSIFGNYSTGISSSCNFFYTGISEGSSRKRIECYPNPAYTEISLQLKMDETKMSILEIKNIFGITLKKIDLRHLVKGLNEIKIEISDLPPGLYLLQVDNGVVFTNRQFVKQ